MINELGSRHTGALIATFCLMRPRVAARSPMSGASFRRRRRERRNMKVGARRTRRGGARTEQRLFAPACSSLPSVALRPHVAARAPMSGATLPGHVPSHVVR
jgi:hypothetical protein